MSGLIIPGNMKLGGAVVTLSLHQKQLDAGINTAKGKILRFTKWVWNHRRGILIGGGLATAGGTAAGMMANDAMSVWTETELALNRLKILTDGMKGNAGEFALKLGKDMNVSAKAAVDLYSRFFAMGRGLEMAQEEADKFSQKLSVATHQFAALHALDIVEASDRMVSAMSGSAEVMDQFGVNLRQSQIELELQKMGIKQNAQQADELSKSYARLNIIMDTLERQGAGKAVSTYLESWYGVTRRLSTAWEKLKVAWGKSHGPAITRLVSQLVAMFEKLVGMYDKFASSRIGQSMMDHVVKPFEALLWMINQILKVFDRLVDAFTSLDSRFGWEELKKEGLGGVNFGKLGGIHVQMPGWMRYLQNKMGYGNPVTGDSKLDMNRVGGLLGTYSTYTSQQAQRAGPQAKADKQLMETKKQTGVLENIERNTQVMGRFRQDFLQ